MSERTRVAAGRIKVALIGAGSWGRQQARVLSGHPDLELCAILGRDPQRLAENARAFGAHGYTDLALLLEREKPDLVSVCLPSEDHYQTTLAVIRAGVPLLVEKPLVFDEREAETLLEEAAKRGLFFAINFNLRYARANQLALQAVREGRLGDVVFVTWRSGGEGAPKHPYAHVIQTQCHAFDMLELCSGPIESVMAQMTDKTGNGFRTIALALRFRNGAVGTILGSYDSSWAYCDSHRMEINGTKGRVVVEDVVRRFSFQATGSEHAEVWEAGFFNDFDREFHRTFDTHFEALLAAFKAGQPPPVPATAGHRALVCANAAIRSFECGHRVEVPPPAQQVLGGVPLALRSAARSAP